MYEVYLQHNNQPSVGECVKRTGECIYMHMYLYSNIMLCVLIHIYVIWYTSCKGIQHNNVQWSDLQRDPISSASMTQQ